MTPQSYYRCWVEIDLDALRHNVAAIRRRIGPNTGLIAVVKADAYGHGLAQVSGALMQCGVESFAVANLSEALLLRHVGGGGWPILLFGSALPFEVPKIVEQNIMPTISTLEEAQLFEREAAAQGKLLRVQVEVDTGMGRVGFWHEDAADQVHKIATLPHLHIDALYTHFPSADENLDETRRELELFAAVARKVKSFDSHRPLLHAANSAALLNVPEAALDMVRPGLLLYGIAPNAAHASTLSQRQAGNEFLPVLSFKARVAFVKTIAAGRTISYGQTFTAKRPMNIATLAAGYGDGFARNLSNNAQVLIAAKRCPVLGRVTMDQIMVDVTELPHVACGDEAVFIGRQPFPDAAGETAEITVSETARWAGTIAWEVLCGITKTARVPRVYRGASAA
jgi:alanine racemase